MEIKEYLEMEVVQVVLYNNTVVCKMSSSISLLIGHGSAQTARPPVHMCVAQPTVTCKSLSEKWGSPHLMYLLLLLVLQGSQLSTSSPLLLSLVEAFLHTVSASLVYK